MSIWKQEFTVEGLNAMSTNTLVSHLKINFTSFGEDYLVAEMPVTNETVQPMRILHGGASVVLAETLGSVASVLCLEDPITNHAVGLDINANHLRSVPEGGKVFGKVMPIHIGRKTHVWKIELTDESGKMTCISRLTMMIRQAR
jgi:1,4-dihydroxy-2-naphthoyl-CoA hydrolase